MLSFLAEFLSQRGYYNEAAYFINFHELSESINSFTFQTLVQALRFQVKSSDPLKQEQILERASGNASIGTLPITFGPSSDCKESQLPYKKLPSHITVEMVNQENDLSKMEEKLQNSEILGMDAEWKPIFTKFESSRVALLQISTKENCFLIDLIQLGENAQLNRVLSKIFKNKKILKLGFSFNSDLKVALKSYPKLDCFKQILKFLDIQKYYKKVKQVQNISLTKACQNILKEKLCKKECVSNWEQRPLRGSQLHYAALDAYSLIEVYERLSEIQAWQQQDLENNIQPAQPKIEKSSIEEEKQDILAVMKYKNLPRKEDILKLKIVLESSLSTMKKHLECKNRIFLELGMVTETIQAKWKKMHHISETEKNVAIFTNTLKVYKVVEKCPIFYFSSTNATQNFKEFSHFLDQDQ